MLTDNEIVNIILHELGHTLGLAHTHDKRGNGNNGNAGNCYQEAVSRTRTQGIGCLRTSGLRKCEVNGDMLCDTEADPLLSANNVNTGCAYTGGGTDNWGDAWTPPTTNYMSYSRSACQTTFTQMQRGVMYFYAAHSMTSFWPTRTIVANAPTFYRNGYVDVYENDNFWANTAPIPPSENQYRALHGRSTPAGDVDWLRFTVNTTDTYTLETSSANIQVNPDTWLDLFTVNANGAVGTTPLVSDDDSGDGYFSKIVRSLAPGNYALRVRGYNASVTGPYSLKVVPQSYTDPAPALSVNISGPTYVGNCESGTWTATGSGGAGNYTYAWFIDGTGQQVGTGSTYQDYAHYYATNDEYHLRVEVTSGSATANSRLRIFSAGCGGSYRIYPNPASDQFEVAAAQEAAPETPSARAAQSDSDETFRLDSQKKFNIRLCDKYDQTVASGKSKDGKVHVDTRKIPDGMYFLHIEDGKTLVTKKVMVKR